MNRAKAAEGFICLVTENVVEISNGSVMQMVDLVEKVCI